MNNGTCAVSGCDRALKARKFCGMHYKRFMKHGDPLKTAYQRRDETECRVMGCDHPTLARGLCGGHYQRERNGLPLDTPLASRYRTGESSRKCSSCHTEKPLSDFAINSGKRPSSWCKGCRNYAVKLERYGLDRETYDAMVAAGCEACGSHDRIHIDHDHINGAVRGALCSPCNVALGHMQDDPVRLEKLASYIRRFSS